MLYIKYCISYQSHSVNANSFYNSILASLKITLFSKTVTEKNSFMIKIGLGAVHFNSKQLCNQNTRVNNSHSKKASLMKKTFQIPGR